MAWRLVSRAARAAHALVSPDEVLEGARRRGQQEVRAQQAQKRLQRGVETLIGFGVLRIEQPRATARVSITAATQPPHRRCTRCTRLELPVELGAGLGKQGLREGLETWVSAAQLSEACAWQVQPSAVALAVTAWRRGQPDDAAHR